MPDSDSCDDFFDGQSRQRGSVPLKSSAAKRTDSGGRSDAMPASYTSRCSVRHAVSVIDSFSEYKRWLVKEIGFGGLLELPMIQKLNLKLSSWTMSKVDPIKRAIVINAKKVLPFSPSDVAKVFGIPCGNRDVRGPDGNINEESISFIKKTLGMDHSAAHSLRAAEDFLNRNITEESSKLEKDCFQIAFVIFVMGHVLAPSSKHDYKSIDFWGALASTEEIAQFNWCEYVLQCLLDAVTKLKIDIDNGVTTANLTGCHLFLQVFFLDNLDLGIFNMKHDALPRVKQFDQDSLRRMTTMATDVGVPEPSFASSMIRDPSTVCYSRSVQPDNTQKDLPALPRSWVHPAHPASCSRLPKSTMANPPGIDTEVDSHVPPPKQPSALDYSNYIANRYPAMSSQPLAVLLREQNARAIRHVTMARQNIQNDMVSFTDKLMSTLASACTCCAARGLLDCPLKLHPLMVDEHSASGHAKRKVVPAGINSTAETSYQTPKARKLSGVRLDLTDSEGDTSSRRSRLRKGNTPTDMPRETPCEDTSQGIAKLQARNESICNAVQHYASCIVQAVKDLYTDCSRDNQRAVSFGVSCAPIPKRKYISSRSYASNPWFIGRPVLPPKTETAELLASHLSSLPENQLARNWILHADPRLVKITGHEIIDQLVRNGMLDHELGSILIRRQSQLDAEASLDTPYLTHRHLLECDFSTLALADNASISRFVQIQNQFIGLGVLHAIEACQLFYIPAILRDGWALYVWDMLSRIIHIIDPASGPGGCTAEQKERHELIASRLHDALFQCLHDFFAGWPTSKDNWSTKYPLFLDNSFSRQETGLCVMHIMRYHDGEKLRFPLTKNNLSVTKKAAMQEAMKLQGNQSSLPADAIWQKAMSSSGRATSSSLSAYGTSVGMLPCTSGATTGLAKALVAVPTAPTASAGPSEILKSPPSASTPWLAVAAT